MNLRDWKVAAFLILGSIFFGLSSLAILGLDVAIFD